MSSTETLPDHSEVTADSAWKIKLLYDGLCPLCLREVNFLQQRDAGRGTVVFVDIADLDYAPENHGGVNFADAMGRIHAVLPDGTVLRDVAVFRRVYEELGMGWVYAATRWPVVGAIANGLYTIWANWRLAVTGRPNLETIVADRQTNLDARNRCRLNGDPARKQLCLTLEEGEQFCPTAGPPEIEPSFCGCYRLTVCNTVRPQ